MNNQSYARSYLPEPDQEPKKKTPTEFIKEIFKPGVLVWVLLAFAVLVPILVSLNQPNGILWLFSIKEIKPGELGEISIVLAPLLALALAIERIIETIFDMFEQSITDVANLSSGGNEVLIWFNEELNRAWAAAEEISNQLGIENNDNLELLKKLEIAEQRIAKANNRISGLKSDPKYISTKRVISIWLGLLLGLIVATISDKGIFELLQIGVPRFLDMIVTGFVIGAGSGPMHSLVGILQGAKNTLDRFGELASLNPIKNEINQLRSEIRDR